MERRKRVKTNTHTKRGGIGDGEISLSSSSSSPIRHSYRTRSQNQAPLFVTGNPSANKKVAQDEDDSSDPCSSSEEEEEEEQVETGAQEFKVKGASMDTLPPEMLMEILKCVETRRLFNYRLVSRQWDEIASGILRQRRDAQIRFVCNERNKIVRGRHPHFKSRTRGLQDFLNFMKTSKNCPYSHFAFTIINFQSLGISNFFDHTDFKEFLSDFSSSSNPNPNPKINQTDKRIKGLELRLFSMEDVASFQTLVGKLRDLLLNKIPTLEELGLEIKFSRLESQVKFFPNPNEIEIGGNSNSNSNSAPVPAQLKLPHLKSIRLNSDVISAHSEFAKDLLKAAVNLTHIYAVVKKPVAFEILHSLGKLHLVKDALIFIDEQFFPAMQIQHQQQQQQQQCTTFPPFPQLQKLDLKMCISETDQTTCTLATSFLAIFLDSNKNNLISLKLDSWIDGFTFLPGLQFPTFKKLQKLEITLSLRTRCILPPGSRALNIFPTVTVLDLNKGDWLGQLPREDSIPLLPNVKTLTIDEYNCTGNFISIVALLCPNLKTFQIRKTTFGEDFPKLNFSLVGRSIWRRMKQLESLEVDVNLNDREDNNSTALDSCFTGISIENCRRLYKSKTFKGRKLLRKKDESKQTLMTDCEREHPSILDMTKLKTLKINPYCRGKLLDRKYFFRNKLTWVSEEYAFKFMPHLKPEPNPQEEIP